MFDLARNLDLFGAVFQLNIDDNKVNYRSKIGGYISLIVYLACFSYAIYVFLIWKNNGYLPIVTTNTRSISQTTELDIDFNMISQEITYISKNNQSITYDVFTTKNNRLFQQLTINYVGTIWQVTPLINANPNCKSIYNQSEAACLNQDCNYQKLQSEKNQLTINSDDFNLDTGVGMAIGICANYNSSFCASKEQSLQYMNLHDLGLVQTIKLQNYDSQTQKLEPYIKTFLYAIDPQSTMSIEYSIEITEVTVQEGLLFPQQKNIRFISGVSQAYQGFTQNPFITRNSRGSFAITRMRLNPLKQMKNVQHITLGQILASVGSIFSLIMLLGEVTRLLNAQLLENMVNHKILQIYFPQLKSRTITKNFLGRVTNIEGFTPDQTLKFIQTFGNIVQKKKSFLNIIEEIAFLKWAIYNLYPIQSFEQLKFQGLRLHPTHHNEQFQRINQVGIESNTANYRTQVTKEKSPSGVDRGKNAIDSENQSQLVQIKKIEDDNVIDVIQPNDEVDRIAFLQFKFYDPSNDDFGSIKDVSSRNKDLDLSRVSQIS